MIGTGKFILLSGQIGWNSDGKFADGFLGQTELCLRNILTVLHEASAGPQHIARLTWYVTDIELYRLNVPALGALWRNVMGRNYPAMAVVGVTSLVEPNALIEIEATAVIPE